MQTHDASRALTQLTDSREVIEILLKLARTQANQPYGEGFWTDRFRFLDYTGSRYMEVQERLLIEQLHELGSVPVGGSVVNGSAPGSMAEFMRRTPLTSIEDYATALNVLRQSPRGRNYTWAYTLYGPGIEKWVPYTQRALKVFGENTIAALAMAAGHISGHSEISPGMKTIYNVPPRPYLAGIAAIELSQRFGLKGLIDPAVAEGMEFEERIREEFNAALTEGVDVLISMTSVLRRISERFEEGLATRSDPSSSGSKGIRATARYVAALGRAKLGRRKLKPCDLWRPRSILGWGLDTRYFRQEINADWGRPPFEMYASTEAGSMGLQYGEDYGIALNPETCFFEFLPEPEIDAVRNDPKYTPQTVLLPDVHADCRYEVVITSFYGMPFVRYRTGHLVRFSAGQLGYGPDLEYVGRADERLDIGGFTRIDEATIWKAIASSGVGVRDWIARRETSDGKPVLRLYAELSRSAGTSPLSDMLHASLVKSDPLYADVESMLGWQPLRVTLLAEGTFGLYYESMRKAGAELMARKPQRINASDTTVNSLLALNREIGKRKAA